MASVTSMGNVKYASILALKKEFDEKIGEGRSHYFRERKTIKTKEPLVIDDFYGSGNTLNFLSKVIIADGPALLAAPQVTLAAKRSISLGIVSSIESPLRLFVPEMLTIATKHLLIGENVKILNNPPKNGVVFCKKLLFLKGESEQDSEHFEIVKSWIQSDETEVEIALSSD